MEQLFERVKELIAKKSKIGNADSMEAAELIYKIHCSNKDFEMLVNFLYDFYYRISGIFAKKYYLLFTAEERNIFIEGFIKNKKFNENLSGAAHYRGFAILSEIIQKDNYDANFYKLINSLAKIAEKNNGFNKNSCETFLNFLNSTKAELFELDFSSVSEAEIKRLFRYTNAAISGMDNYEYKGKMTSFFAKYSLVLSEKTGFIEIKQTVKATEIQKAEKKIETPKAAQTATKPEKSLEVESVQAIVKVLQTANQEVEKLLDNVFNKNNTIQNLLEKLNAAANEISLLKAEIDNKNTKITALNEHIDNLKEHNLEQEAKIKELDERLKLSFNADDISKKQELMTLKTDIAKAIKLQYEDFSENKNESCNEDNYEALKVTLNQVFRSLKRYGIEL